VGRHSLPLAEGTKRSPHATAYQPSPSQKARRRPMPTPIRRANARKSAVRARIEHVFAEQKDRIGLFIRTIGLARENHDRARQPRLQHEALHLVGENGNGDIAGTAGSLQTPSTRCSPTTRKNPDPSAHHPSACTQGKSRRSNCDLALFWGAERHAEVIRITRRGQDRMGLGSERALNRNSRDYSPTLASLRSVAMSRIR
jgi:hypothetical protein